MHPLKKKVIIANVSCDRLRTLGVSVMIILRCSVVVLMSIVLVCLNCLFPAVSFGDEIDTLKEQAESGIATAQVRLGLLHENGFGKIRKDLGEARKWFTKASDLGDADGDFNLGFFYQEGLGVATDSIKSRQLLEKAAAKGNPAALEVLASFLVDEDQIKACAYFDLAGNRLESCDFKRSQEMYSQRDKFAGKLSREDLKKAMQLSRDVSEKTPVFHSQLFSNQFPEGEPAFSDEEAAQFADEVLPLVEKAALRKFKTRPVIKCAGRAEVAASLKRDIVPQYKNLAPQASAADIDKQATRKSVGMAPFLLGKYGFEDKTLYVLPRNVKPLMNAAGIPVGMTKAVVKILMAHELTHALQDQHMDLKKALSRIKTQEPMMAFNATIEGHATFVADSVGTALGLDRETIEFARFVSAGVVKHKDAAEEMMSKIQETQFETIYLGGKKFIEYQIQSRGRERLWDVLLNPPTRSSMITVPETYTPNAAQQVDLSPVLAGLESLFGDKNWQVQNIEIGLMQVQAIYANMDPKKREAVIPKIRHIQGLAIRAPKFPEGNGVTLFVLQDSASAFELIEALEEMARSNFGKLNQSADVEVTDISFSDFPSIKADISRTASFKIGPKGKANNLFRFYRIARGKILAEISDGDAHLSEIQVSDIAEEVFKRYQEKIVGKPAQTGSGMQSNQGNKTSSAQSAGNFKPTEASSDENERDMKAAVSCFKANDYPGVRNALRPLMRRFPNHVQARFMLAVMAAKSKDFEKAWLNILVAEKNDPDNSKIKDFIKRLEKSVPRPR